MPRNPCIAQVGDFIVVKDWNEFPDWLGRVFFVETVCGGGPFDPFACCGPGEGNVFYHYVALRHVGRIAVQDAVCIIDDCDYFVLEKRSGQNWGGRDKMCDRRREMIADGELWRTWSAVPGLNHQFRPSGFEGFGGGIIGGCGGDPDCCPPELPSVCPPVGSSVCN